LFARRLVVFTLILAAHASAQELKIAAASDLNPALEKVAAAFKKQSGVQVKVSYGPSGDWFAEIRNGAPFDVFLSADRSYAESLSEFGKTDKGATTYALGTLVLWISNRVALTPSRDNLNVLNSDRIHKVAIASAEHNPYGRAAVATLVHYQLHDKLKPKLVMAESALQAAQFAEAGNAEAALIPISLALTDSMKKGGRLAVVSRDAYPPLYQAGVVLRSSQDKQEAHRFLEFLISSGGQKILQEYGYESPKK
jgi:molybdate transport system substrate-binding protein